MSDIQKIVPSLWFDKETEKAVNFYIRELRGWRKQEATEVATTNPSKDA